MGGSGLAGRPCCCCGAPRPLWANVYEGGRPSGFWGFMGSDELLEFVTWGESDVGRWPAGVTVPLDRAGFPAELLRFEPRKPLRRSTLMELINRERRAAELWGSLVR
jgi:hypothetical protein